MLNFLDGASRVTGAQQAANPLPTAQDEFPLKNQPFTNQVPFPLSGEFADLPQTKIQFDTVTPDPKYYVLPCLETPDFHQEVELAAGAGMFVVGETISKVGPAASGIVLGYSIVDGQPVIAYELVSGAGFGPGDVISGATSMAAGTVSSVERDSAFLQELVGSVMNPAGAGYVFPDQSPVNLSNNQGIQYGCSLGREIRIPFKDTFQVIEDMYIQGDVRGSIRR